MKFAFGLAFFIIGVSFQALAQKEQIKNKNGLDSIYIKSGYQLLLKDSILLITKDTVIFLKSKTKYKVKKNSDVKTDEFYKSLAEKSNEKWLTKQLHGALVVGAQTSNEDTVAFEKPEEQYKQYLGWKISKISYRQVDVISGNVEDTLQQKSTGVIKTLNNIKSKTKPQVLKKNTIIKVGDSLNAGLVNDNERIFRALPYIVDAKIYAQSINTTTQEVELIIVTQDQFSIGASPEFSSASEFALRVYDRNTFGTGTEISYAMIYEKDTIPEFGTDIYYAINNIAGTFTNARISYTKIPSTEAFAMEARKEFITPQTRLGGGIFLSRKSDHWRFISTDTSFYIPFGGAFADTWAGYSPQLFKPQSRKQVVIASRYDYSSYFKRPLVESDSNQQFADSKLFLSSISFRRVNYIKSKLLVGFGRTEDVPIGELFSITAGYQYSELGNTPYIGISFGIARSSKFGILGAKINFGGFINNEENSIQEGAFSSNLDYYAPLQTIGKFSLRNSLKLAYLNGLNMPNYRVINLSSNIRGLSGNTQYGQDKLVANIETVAFSPWYFIGFRFAIYGFVDIGFLGFDNKLMSKNHLYSAIGAGVRIRNENLVFKTIQLRFTIYKLSPENISYTNFDIDTSERDLFDAIEIGKPKLVKFD